MFDLGAIGLAIVCLTALVLIGSRLFPEDMLLSPWRYLGQRERTSKGVREDDDVGFDWGHDEPGDRNDP